MDQLPLDGRITDLRAFARLGRRGRRPVPGRLDQRRGARLHHPRARHRPGARPGVRAAPSGASSSRASPRHVHRVQQVLDAAVRARPQGRASSAGRWCATWASPATSATCTCPPGLLVDAQGSSTTCPTTRSCSICTGSQGEPMAALSRMANRDHHDPHRRGRHRDARVVADPRQRERGLPRHQRADPLGRQGRAQGQRAGARLRARLGRRAALLLQRRPAEQRHAGPRRVAAPARQRRPRRRDRRAARPGRARRGRRRRRPRRRPRQRSSARCRAATSTSTARRSATSPRPSLKDRRILGDEGFISVVVVVDSVTGKIAGGPEIHARGFAEDDAVFDEVRAADRGRRSTRRPPRASATPTSSQQLVRRTVGRWVSDTYRRRPMIIPVVVEV